MESAERKWNCKNCGRRNKAVVAPDGTVKCEYCTEVTSVWPAPAPHGSAPGEPSDASSRKLVDDTRKRGVVARLRERYGEARGLVTREPPYAQPYAHLEWILGTRRNLDQNEADFDTGVSELVVLWLQDLALELDSPLLPPYASDPGGSATRDADSRQAVAKGLRIATRDFAEAFLSPRPGSVVEP